jgi:hypothetical protein
VLGFFGKSRTISIMDKAKVTTQIASQKYLQVSARCNMAVNMAAIKVTRPIPVVKHNVANA